MKKAVFSEFPSVCQNYCTLLRSMSYEDKVEGSVSVITQMLLHGATCSSIASGFRNTYETCQGILSFAKAEMRMAKHLSYQGQLMKDAQNILCPISTSFREAADVVNKSFNYGRDVVSESCNVVKKNPLNGTVYTPRVLKKMSIDYYHGFPRVVDNYGRYGKVSRIVGGDGITRTKLEIIGSYRGLDGVFEYIIEPNREIKHRLFRPRGR